jgi:hypothetical protein
MVVVPERYGCGVREQKATETSRRRTHFASVTLLRLLVLLLLLLLAVVLQMLLTRTYRVFL